MSPNTPLNGCEIKCTFLLCLIYKNSYVLGPVFELFELLFVMINQKLDFGFSESLFTIKIDVFALLQVYILTVVFFHESNH